LRLWGKDRKTRSKLKKRFCEKSGTRGSQSSCVSPLKRAPRRYLGNGIELRELRAASLLGLVEAAENFDPERGIPFWGFAQHRIRGAVKDLFRPSNFAPDYQRKESINAPAVLFVDDERDETERGALLIDERLPVLTPDLSELTSKERTIIEARAADRTLHFIGNELGISPERVRQIETKAAKKLHKGAIARACILDLLRRRVYESPPTRSSINSESKPDSMNTAIRSSKSS
jgi:RNA polymerase sigma factor (sigma-70 family)